MPAYVTFHRRKISDPELLKRYDHVEPSIGKCGGKVLIRADEFRVLEGGWNSGDGAGDSGFYRPGYWHRLATDWLRAR